MQVISDNPYRLARDIRSIGFKSADQIASRLGIERTAMIRARAGISYALGEALDEGHCGLPTDELRALAAELLAIPAELVDQANRAGGTDNITALLLQCNTGAETTVAPPPAQS